MKRILIFITLLLVTGFSHAQLSSTENYVYSKTYLSDPALPNPKTVETVQYIDGLGRPKQVVNVKASPLGRDVVTHIEYDGFGRQVKDFLPVPQTFSANGSIFTAPLDHASNPAVYGSEKIYAEKILESSPLNRVLEQKQVGNAWDTKPVKFDYDANIAGEVQKYTTSTSWSGGATLSNISLSGTFDAAQLYKTTVTDEDGNKTIEFKNGQGQALLVRKVISDTENADTYYVYNEYNQLAYVVPPLASVAPATDPIDETVLNNLCYQYRYDGRNRLVEKKLPGKGWEYMVYDKADRLVLTQDANMRTNGKWNITKYDQFGRVVYTGILPAGDRVSMQDQAGGLVVTESKHPTGFTRNGMQVYYSNGYFFDIETVLSVNYYDTYPTGTPTIPTQILGQDVLPQDAQNSSISTKSLPVASYIKNIEDDNWTQSYTWYDTRGRALGSHSINHLGGYTQTESELDFAGLPLQVITRHKRLNADTERVITETFTYDGQNRLLTHQHQVDNNPAEYLARNEYNELSQLKVKKVGGANLLTPLQHIDYAYNIRGWMTKINDPANLGDDLFGYRIKYNQVEGLETPDLLDPSLKVLPKYNGNIAEVDWKTATIPTDHLRRYGYVYDNMNRLSAGFYQKDTNPSAKEYYEKMTYDLNGNITNLKRSEGLLPGNTIALPIDNLDYTYTGNRLNSVADISGQYNGYPDTSGNIIAYDDNGNMKDHKDKGIIYIESNHLNLTSVIGFDQGQPTSTGAIRRYTLYLYRADGVKLKKIHNYIPSGSSTAFTETTDYIDGFQYTTPPSGGLVGGVASLQFYPTSEGYFDFVNNRYVYNYNDHLGNVRVSYQHNGNGIEVLTENNYYPFGLKHQGYNTMVSGYNAAYQYKYNGKELQADSGMYDYGARFYMADLGRWGVVDPLAEVDRAWSPYRYAYNNPLRFIDPDGRSESDWVRRTGHSNWEYRSDITTPKEAADAGFVDYADGRGDDNSSYTTTLSENGVDTGVKQKVVLGEGGNYTVDGKAFKDRDHAPYVSAKMADQLGKALSAQIYFPAFIMGGTGAGGTVVGNYLRGAATRGLTDLAAQAYFKKGIENVDGRQLLINTLVGVGGKNYQLIGKVALANLFLNTANNFGTSAYNKTGSQDAGVNTAKIFTGAMGGATGIVGGNVFTNTILPSIYMNGTDKVLNDANEKQKKK
ncbi:MAG TPA: DUF6443 domain-containing protein [Flavobacterium sp.]|jgi:RHS repeat-associated protein